MPLIIESTVLTVFNNKKGVAFHKGGTDYPTACHKENVRKYHMKSGVNRAKSPVYTAFHQSPQKGERYSASFTK